MDNSVTDKRLSIGFKVYLTMFLQKKKKKHTRIRKGRPSTHGRIVNVPFVLVIMGRYSIFKIFRKKDKQSTITDTIELQLRAV